MSTQHEDPLKALHEAAERAKNAAKNAADTRSESERLADVARAAYEAARDKPGLAKDIRDIFGVVAMLGRGARTVAAAFEIAAEGWHAFKPYLGPLPRWTSAFYNKTAYKTAPDGTRVFSPRRSAFAAAVIGLSVGSAAYYGPIIAFNAAVEFAYGVGEFSWDGIAYALTSKDEVGVFSLGQPVDPNARDKFRINVCDVGTVCDDSNSTTYLIRDSWFFDAIQLLKFDVNRLSYRPDYVNGSVKVPGSTCKFVSWGYENIKFFRRYITEAKIYTITCEQGQEVFINQSHTVVTPPAALPKPAVPAVP